MLNAIMVTEEEWRGGGGGAQGRIIIIKHDFASGCAGRELDDYAHVSVWYRMFTFSGCKIHLY